MTRGLDPFVGAGEVRALARSMDWGSTPLGPVDQWPRTLQDIVRTTLDSPFPTALWCGEELVFIYNDAYRPVLGAKHPEALGAPGRDVWAEIWGDIAPMFESMRGGGPPVFREDASFTVRRSGSGGPDGTAERTTDAWFTFSLSPVRNQEGDIVAFLNIVAESTHRALAEQAREEARRRAEEAEATLKEVFAQAPSFLAVLRGPDSVFEYVNAAYYQLVGHRDLVGRPLLEAMPDLQGQGFEQLLSQVLETGEPFIGREVPVVLNRTPASPPEERFVDVVYYPIGDPDGTLSGVVAHGSDVTDHVLARQEAQRALSEAERANLAKSQFLATMSHEIRTPINAVMGYTDLLDAGVGAPLSEKQQRFVDGIAASSRHLLRLVGDILDLAKIEAGELTVRTESTPAASAVESALRLIAPQAERKGLELSEEWICDRSIRVVGDEDRIRQVLLNLLSNALKFTESGGSISVRCREHDAPPAEGVLPSVGPWVVLEVRDTGWGMARDQLTRVFEPFIQADSGHTRRAGGTGLGLTISRRLARLMGGELTVCSDAGKGSSFSLWLPPADQEQTALQVRDSRMTEPAELASDEWPPHPDEVAGLASAGRSILSSVSAVEDELVERLRDDPRISGAKRMNGAQLADHTAELVSGIAKAMFLLEEGAGDRILLSDSDAVVGLLARRHGIQRRRLGWTRQELAQEYEILEELLDAALRLEAPRRTAADLGTAVQIVHRLVRRAAAQSLMAFDRGSHGQGRMPDEGTTS